jgi:hypothetical protein
MLAIRLTNTIDLTGMATLALAAATVWLGVSTWLTARESKKSTAIATDELSTIRNQLDLAEQQVALSRQQLQAASRPVVVSYNSSADAIGRRSGPLAAVPQPAGDRYLFPLRNIGAGPALNIAIATLPPKFSTRTRTALAVDEAAFMEITDVTPDDLHDRRFVITYEDVSGQKYVTSVSLDTKRPFFYDIQVERT